MCNPRAKQTAHEQGGQGSITKEYHVCVEATRIAVTKESIDSEPGGLQASELFHIGKIGYKKRTGGYKASCDVCTTIRAWVKRVQAELQAPLLYVTSHKETSQVRKKHSCSRPAEITMARISHKIVLFLPKHGK